MSARPPTRQIPNRTVVTSFSPASSSSSSSPVSAYDEGHYVLHIACGPCDTQGQGQGQFKTPLSCALSNRCVQTYDRETLKLIHSIDQAHDGPITDICHSQIASSGDSIQSPLLVTSSEDGLVRIFDLRTSSSTSSNGHGKTSSVLQLGMPHKAEEALSVSIGYNGALAAVGTNKGFIHFYDLRHLSNNSTNSTNNTNTNTNQQQPLGSYVDAHTDDVTKVRFQKHSRDNHTTTPLLLTASEDGLACTFDTSQPSEELALKSIINIGSPLRDVGFFGPNLEGLYCLTGSETMSVWHHDSAQRIGDFGDVRNHLGDLAGVGIQYLVGCAWMEVEQELVLLAGNHEGDCVLYKVDAGSLEVKKIMSGGHRGCIRSFVPVSSNSNSNSNSNAGNGNRNWSGSGNGTCFITAGEDSRLCEWSERIEHGKGNTGINSGSKANSYSLSSEQVAPKYGGGVIRRQKKKKGHSPY